MRRRRRAGRQVIVVADLERVVMLLDFLFVFGLVRSDEGDLLAVRAPRELLDAGSPASAINWSPDGKSILFTRQEHPQFGDADLTTLPSSTSNLARRDASPRTINSRASDSFRPTARRSPTGIRTIPIRITKSKSSSRPHRPQAARRQTAPSPPARSITTWGASSGCPGATRCWVGGHDATQVSMWLQPIGANAAAPKKLNLGKHQPRVGFLGGRLRRPQRRNRVHRFDADAAVRALLHGVRPTTRRAPSPISTPPIAALKRGKAEKNRVAGSR